MDLAVDGSTLPGSPSEGRTNVPPRLTSAVGCGVTVGGGVGVGCGVGCATDMGVAVGCGVGCITDMGVAVGCGVGCITDMGVGVGCGVGCITDMGVAVGCGVTVGAGVAVGLASPPHAATIIARTAATATTVNNRARRFMNCPPPKPAP